MLFFKPAELSCRPDREDGELVIARLPEEVSFKTKAYAALKQAITNMDIYGRPDR